MFRLGREYWNDVWNYTDAALSVCGILNIIQANIVSPYAFSCKLNMIVLVFMLLAKTFFFLRIFSSYSFLVTMLRNVIYDLRVFLGFFALLIVLFSLMISVLGVGNFNIYSAFSRDFSPDSPEYFGQEYKYTGLFIGNIF